MNLRKNIFKRTLVIAFLFAGSFAYSQPPGGPPPGGGGTTSDPPCWAPPCIPIDGGIVFLIAAGAFFGVRKLSRKSV